MPGPTRAPIRAAALAATLVALVAGGTAVAQAASTPGAARPIETPLAPDDARPGLTEKEAVGAVLAYPKVARWLERYPPIR